MLSSCGRGLLKLLEMGRLGRCEIGEGLTDPLTIVSEARGRSIVIVGCLEGEEERVRIYEVEPTRGTPAWEEIRGDLQLSLGGDVDVRGIAGVLRLFAEKPYRVVEVAGGEEEKVYNASLRALKDICLN